MPAQKLNIRLLVIVCCWLLVQVGLFIKNGIVTSGEAAKYIRQADLLLTTGALSSSNFWFYSLEIFLIMIDKTLRSGMALVIIVHLIINLIATISFYRLTSFLVSKQIGLICTMIFLLNYPFHEFNTFVQTESLYFSLVIILASYLLTLNQLTARSTIIIIGLLSILTFTRPTGILLFPPAFIYIILRFSKEISFVSRMITFILIPVLVILVLNTALGSGGELNFMLPFQTEQVICGVPGASARIEVLENGNSIYGILYYGIQNFKQFSRLALQKSIAFWGLKRDYFSNGHNLFLVMFFYPLYALMLFGIFGWTKKYFNQLLYLVIILLTTWATVIFTCDDWHNRFFLAISPLIIILAAPAIEKTMSFISSGTSSHSHY